MLAHTHILRTSEHMLGRPEREYRSEGDKDIFVYWAGRVAFPVAVMQRGCRSLMAWLPPAISRQPSVAEHLLTMRMVHHSINLRVWYYCCRSTGRRMPVWAGGLSGVLHSEHTRQTERDSQLCHVPRVGTLLQNIIF